MTYVQFCTTAMQKESEPMINYCNWVREVTLCVDWSGPFSSRSTSEWSTSGIPCASS